MLLSFRLAQQPEKEEYSVCAVFRITCGNHGWGVDQYLLNIKKKKNLDFELFTWISSSVWLGQEHSRKVAIFSTE